MSFLGLTFKHKPWYLTQFICGIGTFNSIAVFEIDLSSCKGIECVHDRARDIGIFEFAFFYLFVQIN